MYITVPTSPRNLRLEIIENNPPRVKVTWSPPRDAHGTLKSYRLMWGKRGDEILTSTASIINTRSSYIAQSMSKCIFYLLFTLRWLDCICIYMYITFFSPASTFLTMNGYCILVKGTEYEFRLQAQNEENYGEVAVDYVKTEDGGKHCSRTPNDILFYVGELAFVGQGCCWI